MGGGKKKKSKKHNTKKNPQDQNNFDQDSLLKPAWNHQTKLHNAACDVLSLELRLVWAKKQGKESSYLVDLRFPARSLQTENAQTQLSSPLHSHHCLTLITQVCHVP